MKYFLFFIFFLFNGLLTADLFLKEPSIWPDEAIYTDVAKNIINGNRFATDLWKGLIPGVEKHIYWYPPLYFYSVALWLKAFGISITSQRLLSIFLALGILIIFYFISRLFLKNYKQLSIPNWIILLSVAALSTDLTFIKAAKVSRPEILILFLGLLSLFFFLKTISVNFIISAFFASLAFLTHLIGIFIFLSLATFQLLTQKIEIIKSKNTYLFILFFLLPFIIWIISIYPNYDLFIKQTFPAFSRKTSEELWLISEIKNQNVSLKVIYIYYILTSLIFIIYSFFYKNKQNLLLTLLLLFSWFFALYGRMGWYLVFPVPFIFLAINLLLTQTYFNYKSAKKGTVLPKYLFLLALTSVFIFITLSIKVRLELNQSLFGDNFSYEQYIKKITEKIPPGNTVFLSSIPDPYYAFLGKDEYKLYEFPPLGDNLQNYLTVLDEADYVIYNSHYEYLSFGNFLPVYINKNISEIYNIGEVNQYRTMIIKLKPKKERVVPEQIAPMVYQ